MMLNYMYKYMYHITVHFDHDEYEFQYAQVIVHLHIHIHVHTCNSMKGVGLIFWLSEKAKEVQVILEEKYELPTYAVFILIAIGTIVVGLALGGVSVLYLN